MKSQQTFIEEEIKYNKIEKIISMDKEENIIQSFVFIFTIIF